MSLHRVGTNLPWVFALAWVGWACAIADATPAALTDGPGVLWVQRALGSAYFAAGEYVDAADALGSAASLAPESAPDARNAGIAALLANDLAAAGSALRRAAELDSTDAGIAYALGLLALRSGDPIRARDGFLRCRHLGGSGPEVELQLGLAAFRSGDLREAERELSAVVARGPAGAPRHFALALDRWGRVLRAAGHVREADEALRRARALGRPEDTIATDAELGGGWLALAPVPPRDDAPRYLPAFATAPLPLGEIRWAEARDIDGDGDVDLLAGDGQTLHDLRCEGDDWLDVTASRGLAGLLGVASARALDVNGDGQLDLVRAGGGGVLVQLGIQGAWDPPRLATAEAVTRLVPMDVDRDGDLDFAAAGVRRPSLLRNRGDGSFEDVAQEAGLAGVGPAVAALAGDLDDDGDADLVFVTRRGEVILAACSRGGAFTLRPPVADAPDGAFDVAAGDLDSDGDLDLAVAAPRGVFLLENRGDLALVVAREPVLLGTIRWPASGATSLWIADLDSDGDADLLAAAETGGLLGLNAGAATFLAAPELLRPLAAAGSFPVAAALVDGDALLDLVGSRGACGIARNVGRTGTALALRLHGTQAAHDGIGAAVVLRAGGRLVRREATGGSVPLGLGDTGVDVLRVRWTSGRWQSVPVPSTGVETEVVEAEMSPGLGLLVFAEADDGFGFAGDVLSGALLGQPAGPGVYASPAREAALRIPGGRLRADAEGSFALSLTEERHEVAYLDQVLLFAVDHPESVEVEPVEAAKAPPLPALAVHVLDHALPPRYAADAAGGDVTDRLVAADGFVVDARVPDDRAAEGPPALELDFGEVPPDAELTLQLAGAHSPPSASARLAASQDPRRATVLPRIEVPGPGGEWALWPAEVDVPGGGSRSVAVDVSGAFPNGHARLRLSSTLRIAWDRAALQVGESPATTTVRALRLVAADLHERGRSQLTAGASGEASPYDHEALCTDEPTWDQTPGNYTAFGDVAPLLLHSDDRFAILATGDECTLRFVAADLPELPPGEARTFFLAVDGWVKDGDPNTAHGDHVDPLPFHTMSGYPYRADEAFPDDDEHRAYRADWNTRPAKRLLDDPAPEERVASTPSALEVPTP